MWFVVNVAKNLLSVKVKFVDLLWMKTRVKQLCCWWGGKKIFVNHCISNPFMNKDQFSNVMANLVLFIWVLVMFWIHKIEFPNFHSSLAFGSMYCYRCSQILKTVIFQLISEASAVRNNTLVLITVCWVPSMLNQISFIRDWTALKMHKLVLFKSSTLVD